MSGVVADVDASKRAEAAVVEADQRFRDVAAVSSEYIWETDAEWRYTYLSERIEALMGYPRAELLGRKVWEFVPLGEERAMRAWFAAHGGEGAPFRGLVHRAVTRSGGVLWQSLAGVPLHDAEGRWTGYRGTAADVTARKHDEARIEQLATRDALTGLANRSLVAERTALAILNAARNRTQLALLAIDLDRFKLVNESLGHAAGDALVRAVAERLQNALRREDTLGRVGGDDFVLLWNGLKSREEAGALGERLLSILGRPFTIGAARSRWARRSASPFIRAMDAISRSSSSTPTPPCTTRRTADEPASASSIRRSACAPRSGCEWRTIFAPRSREMSCCCTGSPSCGGAPRSSAPRRWCAGSIRRSASSGRRNSCRSLKTRA
jgi:diguanylate cyclase (GGDEF)-like protein/PAS domain S-box-containing protein